MHQPVLDHSKTLKAFFFCSLQINSDIFRKGVGFVSKIVGLLVLTLHNLVLSGFKE